MGRSGALWTAAVLSLLGWAAWTISRPDGLTDFEAAQPEGSSGGSNDRPTLGAPPDSPDPGRTRAEVGSGDGLEQNQEGESSDGQLARPIDVTVVGRVQDPSRVPIADAELELVQLVDDRPYGPRIELRSSADGSFRTVIPIARWGDRWGGEAKLELEAWAPDCKPDVEQESVRLDEPQVEFKMTLWPGGVLTGRVVDVRSEPVAEAQVDLMLGGEHDGLEDCAEDGTYSIEIDSPGEYVLHARKDLIGVADPLSVNLRTDQRNEVPDLVLVEGPGVIAGVLVDSFGGPIADHRLTAMGETWLASNGCSIDDLEVPNAHSLSDTVGLEEHGLVYSRLRTEADGSFRFSGLAPGKYAIRSGHAGRKVWVVKTGQRNLRLVRELYVLHVEVRDQKDPERQVHGRVFIRPSGGEQSFAKLRGGEVRIPVRPRVNYVVGFQTPNPTSIMMRNRMRSSSSPPLQMGFVERRVWIDPGEPNPSVLLVVDPQLAGTLEVRCRLPKGLAGCHLEGKIVNGGEGLFTRSFWMKSSSVERISLVPGAYVVNPTDELNSPISGWIRKFAVAPPSQTAFPSNWSLTIPAQSRHWVEVPSGETAVVDVEMVEAGAVLVILGSEEDSVPRLERSTLTFPHSGSRSDTTRGYFISWDEGRPVSGHLLQWSLGAGDYKWTASAAGFRDLKVEFAVTAGELTVVRETWRR